MDPLTLEAATSLQCHPSGLLSCNRAKIWTDGGLGAKTAAMLEPYADDKDSLGTGLFFGFLDVGWNFRDFLSGFLLGVLLGCLLRPNGISWDLWYI